MASMFNILGKIIARRFHEHPMDMKPFWIDKYPVTNSRVQGIYSVHQLSSSGRLEFSA